MDRSAARGRAHSGACGDPGAGRRSSVHRSSVHRSWAGHPAIRNTGLLMASRNRLIVSSYQLAPG
jgi:hypothetical protein